MTIPIGASESISEIAVVEIDKDVFVDPVFLANLEEKIKQEEGISHVAFIQIIENSHGKGWTYLHIQDDRVSQRYLYDPYIHEKHLKLDMTNDIWHGENPPSLDDIKHHSKIIKIGYIK